VNFFPDRLPAQRAPPLLEDQDHIQNEELTSRLHYSGDCSTSTFQFRRFALYPERAEDMIPSVQKT